MSGAVGRRLLGNILHEGHSLSISQDFPWVKTSHLFSPVHECLVCIPGSFLLLRWQQERWHGWRGLTLDSVCAQLLSLVWLCDPMDCSLPGWSVHGDSLGKNNGVGLHALLQGIFPTQGLNWSLLHFRQVLYHLSQGWTDNRDLFPVLFLQFILLPCANDILFSLFSIDETEFFRLFGLLQQNTTDWVAEKKLKFLSHIYEAGVLRSGGLCGWVRALLQVTSFSL